MWCVAWFGTICTIEKKLKNTHGGVFKTSFKLLHGWFSRLLNCRNGTKSRKTSPSLDLWEVSKCIFSQSLSKSKKKYFQGRYTPWRWGKKWNLMTFFWRCQLKIQNILLVFCNAFGNIENVTQIFRSLN